MMASIVNFCTKIQHVLVHPPYLTFLLIIKNCKSTKNNDKVVIEEAMKMPVSNGKLPVLKIVEQKLCKSYIFGKQKNVSFSKRVREPKVAELELIHTNICGLSPVTSLGYSRYYC